ncbi:MAG: calcium/sodium antiporter [Deltaproteobacteria bacterium]|nr:calcium/sodium antiporter [Deltaproteobacteria bacterium]MCW5804636.1 calcium/sodium antiporter [Deltaproteobacteria bacterium]
MPLAVNVGFVIVGIAVLYWGAEWLIRGSASLARAFGVKPLVVGLTVVAYGASAPELAVSTKTALTHHQPIAVGTVVGSCAANISLILGLTALISPPTIDSRLIKRELPILLGSAIAVPLLLWNGVLSRFEGAILIGCAVMFTVVTLTVSARDLDHESRPTHGGQDGDDDDDPRDPGESDARMRAEESGAAIGGRARPRASRLVAIAMSAAGLVLLIAGADMFVFGGRSIATDLGMSERMLGLTVISLGCALPELVSSLVAAARGHSALAVGSVIGSNLLNVFLVLGVTAYLRPINLGERMHLVELLGLVAITLLGILTLRGSRRITRIEGAILVLAYVAFVVTAALF